MIEVGDVVQINEHSSDMSDWTGCLAIVESVRQSGLVCTIKIPRKGDIYLTIKEGDCDRIGRAALTPFDYCVTE